MLNADTLLFIKHNHCHHHRVLEFFVVIAMLYTMFGIGIGIARGQYYWVLDIGCLSWYRSNPTCDEFAVV